MKYFPLKIPIKLQDDEVCEENCQRVSKEAGHRPQRWAELTQSGPGGPPWEGVLAGQAARSAPGHMTVQSPPAPPRARVEPLF